MALSIRHSRNLIKGISREEIRNKFIIRGLWIFSLGLGVTMTTYLLIGQSFIIFGVLHLVGISTILAWPFFSLGKWNVLAAPTIIFLGVYLQDLTFSYPWLLWLDLYPKGLYTLDYFPLLPWFGVILLGISLGGRLYSGYARAFKVPDLSGLPQVKLLCFFGRNSLVIYLTHQPVLVTALWLFRLIQPSSIF
jgi:uncharacterized membrane protein